MRAGAARRPHRTRAARALGVGCLTLAGALAVAGCGVDPAGNARGATQSPGTSETATVAAGVQQLSVTATDMLRFDQTQLTAHVGTVALTLNVPGMTEHDLVFLDGPQGGTSEISAGSTTVTLRFVRPGTYHYVCTIHPRMRGTLTILPAAGAASPSAPASGPSAG